MNKVCSRCSKTKDYDDFHRDSRRITGHKGVCKTCINPGKLRGKKKQAYRLESHEAQLAAPCNNCYYVKRCTGDGKKGWSCPIYRRWSKGYKPRENEERIPDKRYKTEMVKKEFNQIAA